MIPKLFTTKQAAELLGLKTNSLEILRCQGRGPVFIKICSRSIRYAESDLLAYLEAGKRQSTSQDFDHKSSAQSTSNTGRT